ncbi:aminoglycoside 6-adenylyltransferase [Neolewinella lacunae]|uniref:Aminoglycoside 6-adenylyltransferase n=1 Tax=Neolewinella lacunae TaxID=1517758 RepID=A0A923T8K0_9BACT|nr:aminoglycoside 6-adenylyltransferase [Neolewinella lacunae]MBC6994659.1 aminoglycoside 6-adenylyltransferase [Neolewinella lacunae]MDN3634531.1 aminoglycoside 6-adenylyltransferase [Neolewinella lacunae]
MVQQAFARQAKNILATDDKVIGLAVGGSWLADEVDEFSDLDLVLVTQEKISHDLSHMLEYARKLGDFISGFTGEHVGEPRLLICLYDNPLLHVDLKFLTLEEFGTRVETPVLLLDKEGQLANTLQSSQARFPYPSYQWIEDRFWTWIHYALTKIGRGEYVEAVDFFAFLRMLVLGPLLHIKNGNLPRGVRKVEKEVAPEDLAQLKLTIPTCERKSLLDSLGNAVNLYRHLRTVLYDGQVNLQREAEEKVMTYFTVIQHRK